MVRDIVLTSPSEAVTITVKPLSRRWRLEVYSLNYQGKGLSKLVEQMRETAQRVGGTAEQELQDIIETLEG
jgi:hypothetical protein